eukprot:7384788-Prymnesium_polylepis.1
MQYFVLLRWFLLGPDTTSTNRYSCERIIHISRSTVSFARSCPDGDGCSCCIGSLRGGDSKGCDGDGIDSGFGEGGSEGDGNGGCRGGDEGGDGEGGAMSGGIGGGDGGGGEGEHNTMLS